MVVSALSSIKGITNICWYSVCIVVACKLSVAFFFTPSLEEPADDFGEVLLCFYW